MDDRTKGVGERGRADEQVTGLRDETRTSGAYDIGSPRAAERPATTGSSAGAAAHAASRQPGTQDPETRRIRADIERTREDLSETIDAIQDRLRPSNVASNAVSSVRDAASERFQDVAESDFVQEIRTNPAPAIMVGIGIIGLTWLMSSRGDAAKYRGSGYTARARHSSRGGYAYGDRYFASGIENRPYGGERYGAEQYGAEYGAREYESSGRSGIAAGAGQPPRRAPSAARTARRSTRRAQSTLQRMLNENPLMVGAAAAAIGAAIGMALPETERENELMGEARDSMIENVQEKAQEAAERVQNAASEAAERVQNVASEAVGLVGGNDRGENA